MREQKLWSRFEAILDQALDAPAEERSSVLARLAEQEGLSAVEQRELDSLIAAAEADPTIFRTEAGLRLWASSAMASPRVHPDSVGPYRLLERLGRGGMGDVYLAQRTDGVHSTKVAVKLLRMLWDNPEVEQRFHIEREILASLNHPAIARLLDGGASDEGHPYLVMEWVDGLPIDRWCVEQHASVEERLRLFVQVCRAVGHAHRKLVVHRDLKPPNILVDRQGQPKLLDFGIAKLLGDGSITMPLHHTATGLTPLTPAYASPEQLRGEPVSTATDVYALGVLLHELLCGRRPHQEAEANSLDVLIAIREHEPSRPSSLVLRNVPSGTAPEAEGGSVRETAAGVVGTGLTTARLARVLRGDLDQIILRSLAKDVSQRYPSAAQLAADVERFLDGRPIEARAASVVYSLRKFVGRHRLAVAASGLMVSLLLGSLLALLVQREATLEEKQRAELTTSFLVDQLHSSDPLADEAPKTVRELLDRSVDRLDAIDAPAAVRADLETAMGRAYLGIGALDTAHDLLASSLALRDRTGNAEEIVETQLLLSEVEVDRGFSARGVVLAEQALAEAKGSQHPEALLRSGYALMVNGDLDAAEPRLRSAHASPEANRSDRAEVSWILGMLLSEDGRYDEAAAHLEQALVETREISGQDSPAVARILISLGVLERLSSRFDAARQRFDEADRVYAIRLEPTHPDRLALRIHRASVELRAGNMQQAEQLLSRAVADFQARNEGPSPKLAEALDELGSLYVRLGQTARAANLLEEALAMRLALHGDAHPSIAESHEHLALLDVRHGRFDSAIDRLASATEIVAATLGPDHPRRGVYLRHQGNIHYRAGQPEEALAKLEQAREILEVRLGEDVQVGQLYNSLGTVRRQLGQYDSGRSDMLRAIEILGEAWGQDHIQVGLYRNNLARLELASGRAEAALQEAGRARRIFEGRDLPDDHAYRARNDEVRARCLIATGDAEEAVTLLRRRLEVLDEAASSNPAAIRQALAILIDAKVALGDEPAAERQRLAQLDSSP